MRGDAREGDFILHTTIMLHITNGDCAGDTLNHASLQHEAMQGVVLTWRDVLHDGPAPQELTDAELRRVRARFIADCNWQSFPDALAFFTARDCILQNAIRDNLASPREIVLWFEHDLYDQLQLIQILHRLSCESGATNISLICINSFPGVASFHGLGQHDAMQMAGLFPLRQTVSQAQFDLARIAWKAFRAPTPLLLNALVAGDKTTDWTSLPFLRAALRRHLQEFPSVENGLSLTHRFALEAVRDGNRHAPQDFAAIFQAAQRKETAPFMGDTSFQLHLNALCAGQNPFLQATSDGSSMRYSLTARGDAVLGHRAFWNNPNARWIGGVHLTSSAAWLWDENSGQTVVAPFVS